MRVLAARGRPSVAEVSPMPFGDDIDLAIHDLDCSLVVDRIRRVSELKAQTGPVKVYGYCEIARATG